MSQVPASHTRPLDAASMVGGPELQCSLTETHMLTYLASKPVPGARSKHKRIPRAAAAVPHAV